MAKTTKKNEELTPRDFILSRIKSEVKKAGFTYESFAQLFNRTEGWFSNIVNGKRGLSIEVLWEIAKKLKISPRSLLPEEKEDQRPLRTFEEFVEEIIERKVEKKIEEVLEEKLKKWD